MYATIFLMSQYYCVLFRIDKFFLTIVLTLTALSAWESTYPSSCHPSICQGFNANVKFITQYIRTHTYAKSNITTNADDMHCQDLDIWAFNVIYRKLIKLCIRMILFIAFI